MKKSYKALEAKRRTIAGKIIIGIDPGKSSHQALVLDAYGFQMGKPFTFAQRYQGYHHSLAQKLNKILAQDSDHEIVFAIERSCNLWQNLCAHLYDKGHRVVLVSPLSTYQARPLINQDYSRTDQKDALSVASNARQGYFDDYRVLDDKTEAMHRLAITYGKLRKDLQRSKARLRAHIELIFPEFVKTIPLDSGTARYLLSKYILPEEYLALDIEQEAEALCRLSWNQHGKDTLLALKETASKSIGLKRGIEAAICDHTTISTWLALIKTTRTQSDQVTEALIDLAQNSPYFEPIKSLKGISELSSALFLAETYNLAGFTHYKQIEKLAGTNLRQNQSGQHTGRRKLSKIGNKRLRWLLYRMTEEAIKYVPEVRIKYLKRQLDKISYRKNLMACAPKLLELIMALCRDRRTYEARPESLETLAELETQYNQKHKSVKNRRHAA